MAHLAKWSSKITTAGFLSWSGDTNLGPANVRCRMADTNQTIEQHESPTDPSISRLNCVRSVQKMNPPRGEPRGITERGFAPMSAGGIHLRSKLRRTVPSRLENAPDLDLTQSPKTEPPHRFSISTHACRSTSSTCAPITTLRYFAAHTTWYISTDTLCLLWIYRLSIPQLPISLSRSELRGIGPKANQGAVRKPIIWAIRVNPSRRNLNVPAPRSPLHRYT
jgi:hypothetical protein